MSLKGAMALSGKLNHGKDAYSRDDTNNTGTNPGNGSLPNHTQPMPSDAEHLNGTHNPYFENNSSVAITHSTPIKASSYVDMTNNEFTSPSIVSSTLNMSTPQGTINNAAPHLDLLKLSKELKYRELFKTNSKFDGKPFQHFFLCQELQAFESSQLNINGLNINTNHMNNSLLSEDAVSDDLDFSDITSSKSNFSGGNHAKTKVRNGHSRRLSTGSNNQDVNKNAIWNLSFSPDGKYLASAGEDGIIRIWKTISSGIDREERNVFANSENISVDDTMDSMSKKKSTVNNIQNSTSPYAPVFQSRPFKEFHHSDSVISIDWSKNNFLLSSSIDKTIKLWHVNRNDCLSTFKVDPYVSAVKFHKTDDRFFVSISVGGIVNVWSILDKEKVYEYKIGRILTCIEFSPDAEELYVGGDNGIFYILTTKGLVHVMNTVIRRDSKTPRVTGIEAFKTSNDIKILVTTNDSRVRLFSHREKQLNVRFKGLDNEHSTIKATANETHDYIISGSEDGWAYIWRLDLENLDKLKQEKSHKFTFDIASFFKDENCPCKNKNYGSFHVHHSRCNSAIFAPTSTLKLLELSDDPVFDLYNHYGYLVKGSGNLNSKTNSKTNLSSLNSLNSESTITFSADVKLSPIDERPANEIKLDLSTSIIVTTDNKGLIRVFRRDFAYPIRKFIRSRKMKNEMRSISRSKHRDGSRSHSNSVSSHPGLHVIADSSDKLSNIHSVLKSGISHTLHDFTNSTTSTPSNGTINDTHTTERGRDRFDSYSLMEKPQLTSSIMNVLSSKQTKINPLLGVNQKYGSEPIVPTSSSARKPFVRSSTDTSSCSPVPTIQIEESDSVSTEIHDKPKSKRSTVQFQNLNIPVITDESDNDNDGSDVDETDDDSEDELGDDNEDGDTQAEKVIKNCSNCGNDKFEAKHNQLNGQIDFACAACGLVVA